MNKIPVRDRLSKSREHPVGNRNLTHPLANDLEDARFQDHVRIGRQHQRDFLSRPLNAIREIPLGTPQTECPADVLRPLTLEHTDVVFEITPAIEQALHANGA